MRKDPPFDMEFIYTTYILERAELAGALVVNRPQGLRDMNEKVYTAWFPEVLRTHADHPGHGRHGGLCRRARPRSWSSRCTAWADARSSWSTRPTRTCNVVFETLTDYGSRFAIVQRYLPGNRRSAAIRACC